MGAIPIEAHRLIDAVATVLAWTLLATCVIGVAAAPVLVWAMASVNIETSWAFGFTGFSPPAPHPPPAGPAVPRPP